MKQPNAHDGDEKGFSVWYTRFKWLLANRRSSWQDIFEAVEKCQGRAIENLDGKHKNFKEKWADNSSVLKDPEIYAQQLLSYSDLYTKGKLRVKVMKTHDRNAFELLRYLVYKWKNWNKNRLLAFKASALSFPRASNVSELVKTIIRMGTPMGSHKII